MTVINSTFVVRFKSRKTRQETNSQAATIHSQAVGRKRTKITCIFTLQAVSNEEEKLRLLPPPYLMQP